MNNQFTKKESPIQGFAGMGGGAFSMVIRSSGGGSVGLATTVASRSLRFSSAYLTRTPSSEGDRKTWTWSGWVKRSGVGTNQRVFAARDGSTGNQTFIQFRTDDKLYVGGNSDVFLVATSNVFRDPTAWGNLTVRFDTTESTAADRIRIYWNGVQQTLTGTQPDENYATAQINSTLVHRIGNDSGGGSEYYDGSLADVYLIDGTSISPVNNFISLDGNGVYQSKLYSGSYGTNGFHLNFDDPTSTTTIVADQSGQGNNYSANSIAVSGTGSDSLLDVPTNKTQTESGTGGQVSACYATLNGVYYTRVAPKDGNLFLDGDSTDSYTKSMSTIFIDPSDTSGFYCEFTITDKGTNPAIFIQVAPQTVLDSSGKGVTGGKGIGMRGSGAGNTWWTLTNATSGTDTGVSHADGQVIGVAVKNNKMYMAINNTWVLSGNPTTESNALYSAVVGSTGFVVGSTDGEVTCNFGQRPWVYSAPSGYKPISTKSLTVSGIGDGRDHFDVSLWTVPSGSANTTVSGLSFAPDWVLTKNRSQSYDGSAYDRVRGDDKYFKLFSSSGNDAEQTAATRLNLTSDGYVLEADNDNANYTAGSNSVGFSWNAGTSNTSISANTLNSSTYDQRTKWRNAMSGTLYSGYGYTFNKLFNNSDDIIEPAASTSLTFTTPGGYALSGVLEVHMTRGAAASSPSGNYDFKVNGTSVFDHNKFPYNSNAIVNLGYFSNITSIQWGNDYNGDSNNWLAISDIRVNGKELVDDDITPANSPTDASVARANQTAGFSVVTFTPGGTNRTVGHNLGTLPEAVIYKNRDTSGKWRFYHKDLGNAKTLFFNTNESESTSTDRVTEVTAATFKVGAVVSNDDHVAYVFASKPGYCLVGSYEGNGLSDGVYVHTGFRPAVVIQKRSDSTGEWTVHDSTREPGNDVGKYVGFNYNTSEQDGNRRDFLSNGFKLRTSSAGVNADGGKYLFIAMAENPFQVNGGLAY